MLEEVAQDRLALKPHANVMSDADAVVAGRTRLELLYIWCESETTLLDF